MNHTEIVNYFQYHPKLAAGGQPTEYQLQALREAGFEAIVNLSPVSTRNYLHPEAGLVEALGMHYVHLPVDCSALTEIHYTAFSALLKSFGDQKVFIHCGGNIKSSNLIHMYRVLECGIDEQASLRELRRIQTPEEKWFSYFRQMGMQGLN